MEDLSIEGFKKRRRKMAKKPGDYCIPFMDGSQCIKDNSIYIHSGWDPSTRRPMMTLRPGCAMEPNHVFHETLTFVQAFGDGFVTFIRPDGKLVTFMSTEFTKVAPHMVKGKISGNFTFVKRGTAYGCKLVQAD
jgi:hypothetical protein